MKFVFIRMWKFDLFKMENLVEIYFYSCYLRQKDLKGWHFYEWLICRDMVSTQFMCDNPLGRCGPGGECCG